MQGLYPLSTTCGKLLWKSGKLSFFEKFVQSDEFIFSVFFLLLKRRRRMQKH